MLKNLVKQLSGQQRYEREIVTLIPYDDAVRNRVLLYGLRQSVISAYISRIGNGRNFLDQIAGNQAMWIRLSRISRAIDPNALRFEIQEIEDERILAEIDRAYPKELQLRIKPVLATVIPRDKAVLHKALLLGIIGNKVQFAYTGGYGKTFLRGELQKSETRRNIGEILGMAPSDAVKLELDSTIPPISPEGVMNLINEFYPPEDFSGMTGKSAARHSQKIIEEYSQIDGSVTETVETFDSDSALARMFRDILTTGFRLGAADIQIGYDPLRKQIDVWLFVNGVWEQQPSIPIKEDKRYTYLINHVAELCSLGSHYLQNREAEGNLTVRQMIGNDLVAFSARVTFLPVTREPHKEFPLLTVRVIRQYNQMIPLDRIGLLEWQEPAIGRLMELLSGLIVVAGRMGSGKNTFILALLTSILNQRPEIKCVSVEDPVEMYVRHPRMNQSIAPKSNVEARLRTAMKSAHQMFYLDEIGTGQKADIAMYMAESGHITFTTLHCDLPQDVVPRLRGLGISSDRIAGALKAVVATRLLPTLCPYCKRASNLQALPKDRRLASLLVILRHNHLEWDDFNHWTSNGLTNDGTTCKPCKGTGVSGRIGVMEIWEPEFQRFQIYEELPTHVIRKTAQAFIRNQTEQYATLLFNALHYVKRGVVSLESVFKYLGSPDPGLEGVPGFDFEQAIRGFMRTEEDVQPIHPKGEGSS